MKINITGGQVNIAGNDENINATQNAPVHTGVDYSNNEERIKKLKRRVKVIQMHFEMYNEDKETRECLREELKEAQDELKKLGVE